MPKLSKIIQHIMVNHASFRDSPDRIMAAWPSVLKITSQKTFNLLHAFCAQKQPPSFEQWQSFVQGIDKINPKLIRHWLDQRDQKNQATPLVYAINPPYYSPRIIQAMIERGASITRYVQEETIQDRAARLFLGYTVLMGKLPQQLPAWQRRLKEPLHDEKHLIYRIRFAFAFRGFSWQALYFKNQTEKLLYLQTLQTLIDHIADFYHRQGLSPTTALLLTSYLNASKLCHQHFQPNTLRVLFSVVPITIHTLYLQNAHKQTSSTSLPPCFLPHDATLRRCQTRLAMQSHRLLVYDYLASLASYTLKHRTLSYAQNCQVHRTLYTCLTHILKHPLIQRSSDECAALSPKKPSIEIHPLFTLFYHTLQLESLITTQQTPSLTPNHCKHFGWLYQPSFKDLEYVSQASIQAMSKHFTQHITTRFIREHTDRFMDILDSLITMLWQRYDSIFLEMCNTLLRIYFATKEVTVLKDDHRLALKDYRVCMKSIILHSHESWERFAHHCQQLAPIIMKNVTPASQYTSFERHIRASYEQGDIPSLSEQLAQFKVCLCDTSAQVKSFWTHRAKVFHWHKLTYHEKHGLSVWLYFSHQHHQFIKASTPKKVIDALTQLGYVIEKTPYCTALKAITHQNYHRAIKYLAPYLRAAHQLSIPPAMSVIQSQVLFLYLMNDSRVPSSLLTAQDHGLYQTILAKCLQDATQFWQHSDLTPAYQDCVHYVQCIQWTYQQNKRSPQLDTALKHLIPYVIKHFETYQPLYYILRDTMPLPWPTGQNKPVTPQSATMAQRWRWIKKQVYCFIWRTQAIIRHPYHTHAAKIKQMTKDLMPLLLSCHQWINHGEYYLGPQSHHPCVQAIRQLSNAIKHQLEINHPTVALQEGKRLTFTHIFETTQTSDVLCNGHAMIALFNDWMTTIQTWLSELSGHAIFEYTQAEQAFRWEQRAITYYHRAECMLRQWQTKYTVKKKHSHWIQALRDKALTPSQLVGQTLPQTEQQQVDTWLMIMRDLRISLALKHDPKAHILAQHHAVIRQAGDRLSSLKK